MRDNRHLVASGLAEFGMGVYPRSHGVVLCASAVHEIDNSSRRPLTQQVGQLSKVRRNPSRLIFGEQLGR